MPCFHGSAEQALNTVLAAEIKFLWNLFKKEIKRLVLKTLKIFLSVWSLSGENSKSKRVSS